MATIAEERMAVNAALDYLVNGDGDERMYESARVVINFGHKLSPQGNLGLYSYDRKDDSDDTLGCTEQGEFSFQDDEKKSHEEWWSNIKKERIGKFRLWKMRDGIFFHHFWKSSDTTGVDESPEEYCLGYDVSLKPKYLGVYCRKKVIINLLLFALEIEVSYLNSVYGDPPFSPRIGLYILK